MIGLRELAILAVVVLVLYGRSGVVKSRQVQTILPWISPLRRTGHRRLPGSAPRSGQRSTGGATSPGPRAKQGPSCCRATAFSGS